MDAVTPRELFHRRPRIMLRKELNDLRFGKSALSHGGSPVLRPHGRRSTEIPGSRFRAEPIADITYIPTWSGFLYLAVVLDAFSRRIVGWSMANDLGKQVVIDALDMAIHHANPSA